MYRYLCVFAILSFLLLPSVSFADHLLGGEITYKQLEGRQYEIKLNLYRDCLGGGAEFDDPVYLFFFTEDYTLYDQLRIESPKISYIPHENEWLIDLCVQKGEYTATIDLTTVEQDLYIVYQRFSRSASIHNLRDPREQGFTLFNYIPYLGEQKNSSPTFNLETNNFFCRGKLMYVDFSATDVDGDSLAYSLCDVYLGASITCVQPGNPDFCLEPASSPPYNSVRWRDPFSYATPISSDTTVFINPITGIMQLRANTLGLYTMGICVDEYRNDSLIGTLRRDIAIPTINCFVNPATGLEQEVLEETITCYPNPIVNDLYIGLPVVSDDARISLYNVQGQLLLDQYVGSPTAMIPFSNYTSGIYFLKIEVGEMAVYRTVVK